MNISGLSGTKLVVFSLFLLYVFIPGCSDSGLISTSQNSEKLFDYQEIQLKNGLKVITLEDFSCPIAAVQVWYHVGSKNEQPDRQGYAHMFEHMMFKGTDRVGEKDHFGLLNKAGGNVNGYTSFDRTVYLETIPADQVELALWLEAERMNFLRIDQNSFDTERKVVEEELRMGQNRPYGTLYKKFMSNLYHKHPYRWLPIGELAHLRATSVSDLRAFWTKFYVPNNATLIIVGAVEHEKARELAKKYFGWIPKTTEPQRVTIREPQWTKSETIVIDDENAPAGMASIVWRTVPKGHPDEPKLDILAEVLGGGNSSYLYRDLVAEKQLAVEASSSTWNLEHDGLFFTDATESEDADTDQIIDIMLKHVDRLKTEGITEDELFKARNQMLKDLVTQNLNIDSKARLLGTAAVEEGNTDNVNTILDDIKAITVEDIKAVANKYLDKNKMKTFIVKQNKKGMMAGQKDDETAAVTTEIETNPPAPGRPGVKRPDWFPKDPPLGQLVKDPPKAEYSEFKLANGMKVFVVENSEVPFISVKLGLLNGAWTEEKPGTAAMAMQMLTRGTFTHTEEELARILDTHAISLSGSANMDTSSVNANCLVEYSEKMMELMAEVVSSPKFDNTEFEKLRKQVLTSLAVQSQSPQYLADKQYRKAMFGDHPYARAVAGEVEDITALTTADLKGWWTSFIRPEVSTLIFAGDISKARAKELASRYFGSWKNQIPTAKPTLADLPERKDTHIYIVDMPGAAQCQIRVGQSGFTRKQQPDYFISRLVTNYFGGSFNSRLMETIRVKKGLTYGANGAYIADKMAGRFTVSTFTKTEALNETIETIFEEIDLLKNKPPSDDELSDSKSYIAGSFVRSRETPQSVAQDLWLIESQNLQKTYLSDLLAKIGETTKTECTDLVARTVDPEKMIIVVTGDAEKIKEPLSKIAPVTVIASESSESE